MDGKCACVSEHRPQPPYVDHHHIDPIYRGGPDVASNKTTICSATHARVHTIFRTFEKAQGVVPRELGWPWYAYKLAVDGWQRGEARRNG